MVNQLEHVVELEFLVIADQIRVDDQCNFLPPVLENRVVNLLEGRLDMLGVSLFFLKSEDLFLLLLRLVFVVRVGKQLFVVPLYLFLSLLQSNQFIFIEILLLEFGMPIPDSDSHPLDLHIHFQLELFLFHQIFHFVIIERVGNA